jgi:predicted O-methyltransferase YrrM
MKPLAMMVHKDYQKMDAGTRRELQGTLRRLMQLLGANAAGHSSFHDDLFVWFRNHFFTTDKRFHDACTDNLDMMLRGRLWRLYTLCWACEQGLHGPGAIVDIGTYNGAALEVVLRYQVEQRQTVAFDLFDNVPMEARKADHGPELVETVRQRLEPWAVEVIPGDISDTMIRLPDEIAFCQIDLNDHESESAVFPEVYARLRPGSVVIFDDYGFERYRDSARAHQRFLRGRESILELPTGQGLLVKA